MHASSLHAITPAIDRIGGTSMGTTWSVALFSPGRDLHRLLARAQAVLDEVVAQMSHWEADSDLSRYNRARPGWVPLPDALLGVLECALEIAHASGGAFDPTLGELAALWGFGPQGPVHAPPSTQSIAQARSRCGWQRLLLDRDRGAAMQPGGLQLDLSAIAKGHGADRVTEALRGSGVESMLVEVGGELRGSGCRLDGTPWRVLVETAGEAGPGDGAAEADVIALDNAAVATSGDRWHRFRHHDTDYAHTLDPHTGAPLAQAPMAASVIAGDAMRADAWATALSVTPPGRALQLAEQAGVALRLATRDAHGLRITRTPSFERQLAQ